MWIWFVLIMLIVIVVLLIVYKFQQRMREYLLIQQEAWERAQETRLEKWRAYQDRRVGQLEQQLVAKLHDVCVRQEQREIQALHDQEEFRRLAARGLTPEQVEYTLSQVPRIEDMPLTMGSQNPDEDEPIRPPLRLQGAILIGRDLSHRYLRQADLRQAQLAQANFFMADLREADLSAANLRGADLSAANLTDANLTDADLTGANLLVTDLNNARLAGARLHQVRNLTPAQLATIQGKNPPAGVDGRKPVAQTAS